MVKRSSAWLLCTAALAVAGLAVTWSVSAGDEKHKAAAQPGGDKAESPEVAAVREAGRAYARAFNQHDAKALAALWTESGEYDGPDDEPVRGRAALEEAYASFFKENPKSTLDATVESVRLLGPRAATEEGTLRSGPGARKDRGETRFSAFLVLEEGGWRFASVREWVSEESPRVSLADVAWLEGDWASKRPDREISLSYAYDEGRNFLVGKYRVTREGNSVTKGTQIIGRDPNGGLRSWQFEGDGGFGEWAWARDGQGWVIEATGTQPDGSDQTATHLLVPVDKDTFTWQVLERSSGGVAQPGEPPIKVSRVTAGK